MLLPILILILVKFKYPCQCLKTPSLYSLLVPSSVSQIWPSTESPSQMRSWDVQGQVYRIPQLASMKSVKLCLQLTQDWKKVKKSSPKLVNQKLVHWWPFISWRWTERRLTVDQLSNSWDVLLYFYRTLKLTKPQTTQSGLIRKGDS